MTNQTFDRALGILEQWARERGISQHGSIAGQAKKTVEEANEILDALSQLCSGDLNEHELGLENLDDALGGTGVAWIMTCLCAKRDPVEMVFKAIEEIRDRRGYMGEDGIFYKQKAADPEEPETTQLLNPLDLDKLAEGCTVLLHGIRQWYTVSHISTDSIKVEGNDSWIGKENIVTIRSF